MKIAKSPKMTVLLETVPVIALTGISFGGSCGNILNFFGECGIGGVFQYGDTACPDLLCLVGAREMPVTAALAGRENSAGLHGRWWCS